MKESTDQMQTDTTEKATPEKATLFERSDTLTVFIGLLSPLLDRIGPHIGLPDMRYYVIVVLTLCVIWMVGALGITIGRGQFSFRRRATLKSLWVLLLCAAMDLLFIFPD